MLTERNTFLSAILTQKVECLNLKFKGTEKHLTRKKKNNKKQLIFKYRDLLRVYQLIDRLSGPGVVYILKFKKAVLAFSSVSDSINCRISFVFFLPKLEVSSSVRRALSTLCFMPRIVEII